MNILKIFILPIFFMFSSLLMASAADLPSLSGVKDITDINIDKINANGSGIDFIYLSQKKDPNQRLLQLAYYNL